LFVCRQGLSSYPGAHSIEQAGLELIELDPPPLSPPSAEIKDMYLTYAFTKVIFRKIKIRAGEID
jgi:hypothetical protein